MQIITINLPKAYLNTLNILVEKGLYPSRSEIIRIALREFLKTELSLVDSLLDYEYKAVHEKTDPKPAKTTGGRPFKIDMRSIKAGWDNGIKNR